NGGGARLGRPRRGPIGLSGAPANRGRGSERDRAEDDERSLPVAVLVGDGLEVELRETVDVTTLHRHVHVLTERDAGPDHTRGGPLRAPALRTRLVTGAALELVRDLRTGERVGCHHAGRE